MANSSFAVWSENQDINIDLHINCWIFEKNKDVIDFGLMISESRKNDKVYFYIPFALKEDDIITLTSDIQNDESLRSIIFNEDLKRDNRIVDSGPNCKFYKRENGNVFSFCLDDPEHESKYDNGTLLTFKINNDTKGKDTYFRFRLKDIAHERIFKRNEQQVSSLTGVNEEHINIEININQFRKLSNSLQTKIHNSKTIFNRINMFLMADIDLTPIFSTHSEKPKTRILEDADKWANYIDIDSEKRYLAYQYKKENLELDGTGQNIRKKFQSFTIFSKFEQIQASKLIKLYAFIFILVIGILSSASVTYIASTYTSPEFKAINRNYDILSDSNKSIVLIKKRVNNIEDKIDNEVTSINESIKEFQDKSIDKETFIIIKDQLNDLENDVKILSNEENKSKQLVKDSNLIEEKR